MPVENDYNELERRLTRLEGEAREIRSLLEQKRDGGQALPAGQATPQPAPVPPPPRPAPVKRKRSAAELELFGGNLLGKLGMVALILTAGWFVKYAFDNYWINESGRIYTGLLAGFLVMGGGLQLARRRYRILPGPVIGTGLAFLYIAVFGAYYFYDLLGINETFGLLFVLSAAGATLALVANSQLLYAFSLAGAYMAPMIISRGENSYRFLFAYLAVVNAGFFYISTRRSWKIAPFLVSLAGWLVFAGWFAKSGRVSSFPVPFAFVLFNFATLVYREIVLMPRQRKTNTLDSTALVFLNGLIFLAGAYLLLDLFHPDWVPHLFPAAAALFLIAYRLHLARGRTALPEKHDESRYWITTALLILALPLLIAAPYHLSDGRADPWLALLIAAAGVISLAGTFTGYGPVLFASLLLWFFSLGWLFFDPPAARGWPIFNIRFSLFVLSGALLSLTYFYRRDRKAGELSAFLYVAFAVIIAGSLAETHDLIDSRHYRNLGYSLTLLLYATAFLGAGFWKRKKNIRYAGMVLTAVVMLKFYLYDIWTLSRLVRILAGLCLGAGLVTVSILYQKYRELIFPTDGNSDGGGNGNNGDGGRPGGSGPAAVLWLVLGASLCFPGADLFARDNPNSFRAAGFRYLRDVPVPAAQPGAGKKAVYGRIELDESLVKLAGENDLRLTADGRPLPYFRRSIPLTETNSGRVRPEMVFNKASKDGRVVVLKLPAPPPGAEFFELSVDAPSDDDFETGVSVRYGDNADCPHNAGSHSLYRYEDDDPVALDIRVGRAAYLRLEFSTRRPFSFPAARYRSARLSQEYALPVTLEEFRREYDSDLESTVYYYDNEGRRKIHRLELTFEERRFSRGFDIEYLDRRDKTYNNLMTGVLSGRDPAPGAAGQGESQVISFPRPVSGPIKLLIEDEDNPPLTLENVALFAPREEIIFELPPRTADSGLRLYYGNPYAFYPRYELEDTYDPDLPHLTLKPAEHRDNETFAYSIMEPPLSSWIIRGIFLLGLAAVMIPAVRILRKYAAEVNDARAA